MLYQKLYSLTDLNANDVSVISLYRQKVDLSEVPLILFVEVQPNSSKCKKMHIVYQSETKTVLLLKRPTNFKKSVCKMGNITITAERTAISVDSRTMTAGSQLSLLSVHL